MISTQRLAEFCRRVGTSLHAGLDMRQVFAREATIGPAGQRMVMAKISRGINNGETVADAMAAQGYFPPLAVQMTHVGEQTGKLERVCRQLADHYENIVRLRRMFLVGLTWPAIQLCFAIGIVGLLIWIMGLIGATDLKGRPIDILGLGLLGTSGLLIYLGIVALIAAAVGGAVFALSRGWLWGGALMHVLIRVPMIGKCLQYMALSRIAWALSMAIDAGMSATESIQLALRAAQNVYYASAWPRVEQALDERCPMADALRASGRFPEEFLMILETGELSGMVCETLNHHAEELQSRASALLKTLTVLTGMAIGLGVMLIVGLLILRLGMMYVGTIYDALEPL